MCPQTPIWSRFAAFPEFTALSARALANVGRLLVVDDEGNLRQTVAEILRSHGFEVLEAANADDAVRLVREAAPDVVFCDWKMTDGGGKQVLRALHPSAKGPHPTPVIVMTAFGTSDVTIRAMQLGAYDFVTKPLDADELCATADRAFTHVQLQREARAIHDHSSLWQDHATLG